MRNAAVRRFPPGSNLWFGYIIYNARAGKADEGASFKQIPAGGGVKLGLLPIGEYQLQIVVTD